MVLRSYSELCTQILLLEQARGTIWDAMDQTQVSHLRGKCSTSCAISPAPQGSFLMRKDREFLPSLEVLGDCRVWAEWLWPGTKDSVHWSNLRKAEPGRTWRGSQWGQQQVSCSQTVEPPPFPKCIPTLLLSKVGREGNCARQH